MTFKPPIAPNVAVDRAHVYDESTALPVRDGLKFVGSGVTATDDSNNDATIITIPGASVVLGNGSEPFTAVDGLVADPAVVTDWGPTINTAVAGGAHHLLFSQRDYPFSTPIKLGGAAIHQLGLVLEGAAGFGWASGTEPVRLIWKGTGATPAIDLSGPFSEGIQFRHLCIGYDSASFTGDLISGGMGSLSSSGNHSFVNCTIRAISPATNSAANLINLEGVICAWFRNVMFSGAQTLVRGFNRTTQADSNSITFRDCIFQTFQNYAVANPGLEWLFDGCVWEFAPNNGANCVGIGCDLASQAQDSVFTVTGECTFWDNTTSTQVSIKQPVGIPWRAKIEKATFHKSAMTVADIDLQGPGSVHLEDLIMHGTAEAVTTIKLGDVISNGDNSRKDQITVRSITGLGDAGAAVPAVDQIKGHANVQIEKLAGGLSGGSNFSHQVQTVGGYERIMAKRQSTTAARQETTAANRGAYTVLQNIQGSDRAGIIFISTNSGIAAAGVAVDVTFGIAQVPDYRTIIGVRPYLAVHLTSTTVGATWPDGDAGGAAGLYVSQTDPGNYADSSTRTGFSIGWANAIPANKNFAISYRVILL